MSLRFNADEVFAVAEQIERNGSSFYRRAAELTGVAGSRDTLLELAQMEEQHEQTFIAMRQGLSEEERKPVIYDPDHELAFYLQTMADRNVFDISVDPSAGLSGTETAADILQIALGAEKDSIVFYTGLRELVPQRLGGDWIGSIIREEFGHISTLNAKLGASRS
jgi:rubrerythrin